MAPVGKEAEGIRDYRGDAPKITIAEAGEPTAISNNRQDVGGTLLTYIVALFCLEDQENIWDKKTSQGGLSVSQHPVGTSKLSW